MPRNPNAKPCALKNCGNFAMRGREFCRAHSHLEGTPTPGPSIATGTPAAPTKAATLDYLLNLRALLDEALEAGELTTPLVTHATLTSRICRTILNHVEQPDTTLDDTLAAIAEEVRRSMDPT